MMDGISIIICCYNSAKLLPKTIEALANQQTNSGLNWEIIIIDNNSNDNTKEVALGEWTKYNIKVPFRIVDEPNPGLSSARAKGFDVAHYEFCLFCDDDNWLEKGYIKNAYDLIRSNPLIGVVGGKGEETCEVEPPSWFHDLKGGYAVGKQSEFTGDVTLTRGFVYGASAVFRKSAYNELKKRGFKSLLTDRKGKSLSSGGDKELCYAYILSGYKIFYSDKLIFKHFIPQKKLRKDYVDRMYMGFSSAQPILNLYEYVLREICTGEKIQRNLSLLWIKDVLYTLYLLLRSLKGGVLKCRMQMVVLIKLLSLGRTYRQMYEQISSLKNTNKHALKLI